ncbi:hypothetical protein ACIBK9_07795 [Nonomuraea sp. NPDC050227]
MTTRNAAHNGTLARRSRHHRPGFQATRPDGDTALPPGCVCA